MSNTVLEELGSKRPLIEKMISNIQVANLFMGLLGKTFVMAVHEKSKPFEGVEFSPVTIQGGEFRFRITFSSISVQKQTLWQFGSDFNNYVAGRSARMAEALNKNPGFIKFFEDLIEKMNVFCRHKGIRFADLKIRHVFFTHNDVGVIQVNKQHLTRWE